jgi:hypothetical protein
MQRKVHSGIINLFDEIIVYPPDKDSVCSKRGLKQCPSKGDKYVIDEELQHTDDLFLGVACFTFLNFV